MQRGRSISLCSKKSRRPQGESSRCRCDFGSLRNMFLLLDDWDRKLYEKKSAGNSSENAKSSLTRKLDERMVSEMIPRGRQA